ncbi:MAG: type II toxin-antitoxin system prevent-host-death family antitoxin [bacterium]|nr:type II toxin-antitoxin system prevent-host-death family antitoxin [bacterium]
MSATEASRHFSRLLDRAAAGGETTIERRSSPVAVIGPATSVPRKISECVAAPLARQSAMADPGFADDLGEIIEGNPAKGPLSAKG